MKIYLDLAFLEDFFLSYDDSDRHSRLKRLLYSSESPAQLIINFDFEEIYKDHEKRVLFRQIAQKVDVANTDLEILMKADTSSFHETKTTNLFFMNSTSLNTERFGCFSMTSSQLEKIDLLIFPEKFRVDSKRRDWSFLSPYKLPCNSLILTDNYLFSNDETYENIYSILKALMPSNLEIDFDLTIIGYDAKKSYKSIEEQSIKIMTKLKTDYSYNINLTIIREDHHGRYIHTNNTRFFVEKGFGLFKYNRIKPSDETTIEFSSVAEFGRYTSTYEIRNDELEKCKKICQVERMPENLIGNRKNRLLL